MKRKIKLTADAEEMVTETSRPKRLKMVYLTNKSKFWSEADVNDLEKPLDMSNIDNKTHVILQHRIRE